MIAAIESASTDLSVALADAQGGAIDVDGWTSGERQGADLLPRLLALLERRGGASPSDISGVGVGSGPGSFTGLRVGMSLAKGLAYALRLPIVAVPSLETWLAADADALAALSRAGAREAYLLLRGEAEPRLVDRDRLPPEARGAPVVAPAELAAAFGLGGARPPLRAAGAIAQAAASRLAAGSGDDLATLEPRYMRPPRGLEQIGSVSSWP